MRGQAEDDQSQREFRWRITPRVAALVPSDLPDGTPPRGADTEDRKRGIFRRSVGA